jgi:two-component system, cell cycle response regulator DivK
MKSILLVEDSKFIRLATERSLVKAGYTVLSTDDGEQAVRIAREKVPDLILLDMLLPTLSGRSSACSQKRSFDCSNSGSCFEQSTPEERDESEKRWSRRPL